MSDDLKGPNGAPGETVNDVASEVNPKATGDGERLKDVVAYETYKKTLSLAKKREAELEAERAEKQRLLDEKLALEGKKDELIESYKKKLAETETKLKKVVGTFAETSMVEAFKTEAVKAGCLPEYVDKLVRLTDIPIEVGDDFRPNRDVLKELIEASKKENKEFFKADTPKPKTGTPQTMKTGGVDLAKLSVEEKARMAAELFVKQSQ